VEGTELCYLYPWPQCISSSYGTGIQGIILAVVIMAISDSDSDINVAMWRFDICGNESC
jgi:hypothetical protein